MKHINPNTEDSHVPITFLILVIILFALFGCITPAIQTTYKAKCVAVSNDTSKFEYYYNCRQKSPCAIQFDAVGRYEVGKYYKVKYSR